MMKMSQETLSRLNSVLSQVWQSVGLALSEASGVSHTFEDAITQIVPVSDLYPEMAAQRLVIQFAFASNPDNQMVILMDNEFVGNAYKAITGKNVSVVDETITSEMRQIWESVVQGICLGAGNAKGESVVATSLLIRFQILSFPPNLQRAEDLVRCVAKVTGEGYEGSFTLITDVATANEFIEADSHDEVELTSIPAPSATATRFSAGGLSLEDSAFEMLMDVPLEITVELGRVKMLVKDVIGLGSGSIIEIDKAAGEPVDVMVNGRLVARGEVVVIEDNFGVRITEILTTSERLARLSEAA